VNDTFVFAAGNLPADPQLRTTPTRNVVTTLRVAVNHRIKDGDNWADGEATYYDIPQWENEAQNAVDSLHNRVVFAGMAHTEAYQAEDGKRTKTVVTDVELGASLRWATAKITKGRRT